MSNTDNAAGGQDPENHIRPAPRPRAKDVIALARAVRETPELWEIFLCTKPDEWISKVDSHRLHLFAIEFHKAHPEYRRVMGYEKPLLRRLEYGSLADLDDEQRVAEILHLPLSD